MIPVSRLKKTVSIVVVFVIYDVVIANFVFQLSKVHMAAMDEVEVSNKLKLSYRLL